MDRFAGKNGSKLLEIAPLEMFDNRESKEDLLIKKSNWVTVAVLHTPGTFSPGQATYNKERKPLRKEKCAYYKELGH